MHAVHNNVNADALCLLLATDSSYVARVEISPKQICAGHGNGKQIAPIDRDPGPLRWGGFPFVFFVPFSETYIPKGQRLQSRCFAGVVLANKYNRLTQLNVCVWKPFEILNL